MVFRFRVSRMYGFPSKGQQDLWSLGLGSGGLPEGSIWNLSRRHICASRDIGCVRPTIQRLSCSYQEAKPVLHPVSGSVERLVKGGLVLFNLYRADLEEPGENLNH